MESNPYSSPSANLFGSTNITAVDVVSQGVINHLQRTRPWVRLVAVLGFILGGIIVIAGVTCAIAGGSLLALMPRPAHQPLTPAVAAALIVTGGIVYALTGLFYLYPATKLWKYANRIADLVNSRSVADLESALNHQRGFWKFVGVLTVITLVVLFVTLGLSFIAVLVGGPASSYQG